MARPLRDRGLGGSLSLLRLLERYGEEIEFDLLTLSGGLDPVVLFQQRRWRRLHSIIMRLPRTSLTREAMVNDDEFVTEFVRRNPSSTGGARTRRFSEFTPEVEALCDVTDRLGEVVQSVVGLGGKTPKKIKPTPRPKTAFDRVEERLDQERHEKLADRLLPPEQRAATELEDARARRAAREAAAG